MRLVNAALICIALAGCVPPPPQQVALPFPPVPPAQPEVMPLPPVADQPLIWQPGHWDWAGANYAWTPGRWVSRAGHGSVWQPGNWVLANGGWTWVPAHWI